MPSESERPLRHFRAFPRRTVSLPATVVAEDASWQRPARLVDLGLGGACVSLAGALADGDGITLVLEAPHLWEPLRVDGDVVWARRTTEGTQAGVQFRHRSGATLRAVAELLEATLFG